MQYNDEMLKEAFAKYNELFCKTLPTAEQLEHITFSDKFEKRMKKLIRRQRKFYYPMINTLAKRVACFVITMLTLATITTFSVKAFRENFTEFIIEIFEKCTRIQIDEQNRTEEAVLIPIEPTYISEGFKVATRPDSSLSYVVIYKNDKGESIIYTQRLKDDTKHSINTEHSGYEEVVLPDGRVAVQYGFTEDGTFGFIWTDDTYMFEIGGNINQEEALKVVQSVENQKN